MKTWIDRLARVLLSDNQLVNRAVNRRDPVALEEAILSGGSPDFMPGSGTRYTDDTPVNIAVRNSDVACLRVLIKHGAHLSSAGLARQPPLACWFDYQRDRIRAGATLETLPREALEVGALLMEHGARLGNGGRGFALSGVSTQDRIDREPQLRRIQRYLPEGFRADQQARALEQAENATPRGPRRPGARL